MKGQFTWDYLVSIVTFIGLVVYLSLQVTGNAPVAMNAIRSEYLRSEGFQISEILINDPGNPSNWTIDNVNRIGLANQSLNVTNYISVGKIANFSTFCSNGYENTAKLLGADISKYNFSIVITDKSSSPSFITVECGPTSTFTRTVNITFKRYAAIDNGNYAELILQIW